MYEDEKVLKLKKVVITAYQHILFMKYKLIKSEY